MDVDVTSFADIDRIGARVATAARRWLRSVQVRKGVQHTSIGLSATFSEPAPAARRAGTRKRKGKAHSDAAAAE
jgi:hypothetical protein